MYAEILRATGHYTDNEVTLFTKQVRERQISKKEMLLKTGQTARSLYYLLEGSAQQYEMAGELGQNVIDLHVAGEWFLNYESLISQRPSRVFIEAYTDSRILELSLETVHYLTGKSVSFLQLNKVLEGALARMNFFDHGMTPVEKYRYILDHRPSLIQTFPLRLISSYLKVTPETLSRVRNGLAKRGIS
nr:Crp/Fnr family transcriptional regulator [uncultured Dyadobacter sp.]